VIAGGAKLWPPAVLIAGSGGMAEMTLSAIRQVTTIAEKACAVVVAHPGDAVARAALLETLVPIVDPAFADGPDNASAYLHGLLRQVGALGEILQTRIEGGRLPADRESFAAISIQGGARELQRVLGELNRALAAGNHD
jgi:hypothetical protein